MHNNKTSYQTSDKNRPRNIGAIDIGTNSTHLLITAIDPIISTFNIKIAEKETTRLGEVDPETGELTDNSMSRVLETLHRFKELSASHQVEELVVAATSAVREAPNGNFFLSQIRDLIGLDVELISGTEEARLIYLGVLSGMKFSESPHLLIDIGGGSTELILADRKDARALTSTKIGAVRLQRDLIHQTTLSEKRIDFIKTFIQGTLEPAIQKIVRRINPGETPLMVATSGTALALGSLIANEEINHKSHLHGYLITKEKLDKLMNKLVRMTYEDRVKLPQLNERRAEIIIPGGLILQKSMEMFKINELYLSERALREGLILDWMLRHGICQDRFSFQGSIRKRTVIHQVKRFAVDSNRAQEVAKNALDFYDKTYGILHTDNGIGRELLWAASMLHSCGKHINISSYHKHSWYLIRHGELLGYSQSEHLMVAAIARYHRKSLPKKRHQSWQLITNRNHRKIVLEMSLILRLASAIDKRPLSAIKSIKIESQTQKLKVSFIAKNSDQNLNLERWCLSECSSTIKEVCGVDLEVY